MPPACSPRFSLRSYRPGMHLFKCVYTGKGDGVCHQHLHNQGISPYASSRKAHPDNITAADRLNLDRNQKCDTDILRRADSRPIRTSYRSYHNHGGSIRRHCHLPSCLQAMGRTWLGSRRLVYLRDSPFQCVDFGNLYLRHDRKRPGA